MPAATNSHADDLNLGHFQYELYASYRIMEMVSNRVGSIFSGFSNDLIQFAVDQLCSRNDQPKNQDNYAS